MNDIIDLNSGKILDTDAMNIIKQHAKLYDSAYDKKDFLKNISVYEQKIILMNSSKPYEVLNYLDELDLKSSRLLLEELTVDEIKHIISLFSSEDKKAFYNTFSDLSLVNQFIIQDNNSYQHVEELPFERKVELIASSDKDTQIASSVIYESMSSEERVTAIEKVTDIDSISALESIDIYSETQQQVDVNDNLQQLEQVEKVQEQPKEEIIEEKLEKDENKEKQDEYKEKMAEEVLEEPIKEIISDDTSFLEQFQQEKNICEQQIILNIKNQPHQIMSAEVAKTI